MRRFTGLVFCLLLTAACGGPSEEPTGATVLLQPPGTYVLDVEHWERLALPDAASIRFADRMNQATGADPNFDHAPPSAAGRPRPPQPTPLEEMSAEARRAFEEEAAAYVAEEARELRETLTLSPDGTCVLAHASRAAQGGSISLGLVRGVASHGTWRLDGQLVTVELEWSERPGGRRWEARAVLQGELQADGSILIQGRSREWRAQDSLYRPQVSRAAED